MRMRDLVFILVKIYSVKIEYPIENPSKKLPLVQFPEANLFPPEKSSGEILNWLS